MQGAASGQWLRQGHSDLAGALIALAAVFACALAFAHPPLNGDTSWLLTVCERVLAGERLGLDVLEVNPPASVWLYLPAVVLAQAIGVRPDWVVIGMVFLAAAGSIALTDAILRRAPRLSNWRFFVAMGCACAYLWLPRDAFAQREHFAIMLIMPMAMGFAARAWGAPPAWPLALAAGLCAGVALSIKPPFGLALLGPALVAVVYRRSLRPLFTVEAYCVAGVLAAYVACALAFTPAFFEVVLPAVRDVYLARWEFRPAFYLLLWAPAVLLLAPSLRASDRLRLPHGVLLLVALGFVIVFAAQGKNWPYHAYPATAALVAALLAVACRRTGPQRVAAVMGALGAAVLYSAAAAPVVREIDEVTAALPDIGRPVKVLTVLEDHAAVEPAIRAAGAQSVGRLLTTWPVEYVDVLPSARDPQIAARRRAIQQWGERVFHEDMMRLRPDVLIVQRGASDYLPMLTRNPEMAAETAAFTLTRRIEHRRVLEVWTRRGIAGAGASASIAPQTPFDAGASAP